MDTVAIPGFRDIYPKEQQTYHELVSRLDSEAIINLCAALNSELTSPEPMRELHLRINGIASHRFTGEQHDFLTAAFTKYTRKSGGKFTGMLFFRRYLIAMMLRELNDHRVVSNGANGAEADYMFFRAYLKVVEEVHQEDEKSIALGRADDKDPMWRLKLAWLPILPQWEMHERGNIILEMLKTGCFLEYAKENFSGPLSMYLESFGLSRPEELMGSFQAIYKLTQVYQKDAPLRRHTIITVDEDTNRRHLQAQVINYRKTKKITFSDLKKAPIFFREKPGNYLILDNHLAQHKIFRGPFFELFHQTDLKPKDKKEIDSAFVAYSQQIADVLEKRCLKPILSLLGRPSSAVMHFDDGSKNVPDGYIRVDNTIFLFEYKAYFFPERLATEPDFEKLKVYFDQRFIVNEKGKEKGIHQLRKQIAIIHEGGFDFDPEVKELLKTGDLTIFPIIVFNDFYFGINGLNAYLANSLISVLPHEYERKLNIAPMVMMNLETILDMALSKQDISYMGECIASYLDYTLEAGEAAKGKRALEMFYASTSGFDDVYARHGRQEVTLEESDLILTELLNLAGLEFIDYSDE